MQGAAAHKDPESAAAGELVEGNPFKVGAIAECFWHTLAKGCDHTTSVDIGTDKNEDQDEAALQFDLIYVLGAITMCMVEDQADAANPVGCAAAAFDACCTATKVSVMKKEQPGVNLVCIKSYTSSISYAHTNCDCAVLPSFTMTLRTTSWYVHDIH